MEEETTCKCNRREKKLMKRGGEQGLSNSGRTQQIFTDSTEHVLESCCRTKSWPDGWEMTDCQQSGRQLEILAEGPVLKEMER